MSDILRPLGPLFPEAPVRPSTLNMPKSACVHALAQQFSETRSFVRPRVKRMDHLSVDGARVYSIRPAVGRLAQSASASSPAINVVVCRRRHV